MEMAIDPRNTIPRILVCGGRDFTDFSLLSKTLNAICVAHGWWIDVHDNPSFCVHIISGGAQGADALAKRWAQLHGCPFTEFPADWDRHGEAAGPIRNQQMLDEGRPMLVVAFPGGKGTADMVRRAREAGVEVIEVEK